ncbi:hypothetical protein GGI07_000396 [Coemansia sp. Benny D115]|nr:hypothetical protein GGI07_000396 [Coemansia sp. Benny D115]
MPQQKRRRKSNDNSDIEQPATTTATSGNIAAIAAASSHGKTNAGVNIDRDASLLKTKVLHPYSLCSSSVQCRRRAQLEKTLGELSGGESLVDDRAHLLSDMLLKSDGEVGKAVYNKLLGTSALGQIMENIRLMHEGLSPECRGGALALVAKIFTGAELEHLWGFRFSQHQLQDAKRMADEKRFPVTGYVRALPPSRQPKGDAVREAVYKLLSENADEPTASNGGSGQKKVLRRSLRSLHREFLSEHMPESTKSLSFSTFRALALAQFSIQGQAPSAARMAALDTRDKQAPAPTGPLAISDPLPRLKPIRPLVSAAPDSAVSVEPFAQALNSLMGGHIPNLFQPEGLSQTQQMPNSASGGMYPIAAASTNTGLLLDANDSVSQILPGLDLSALGVVPGSRLNQSLSLTLPPPLSLPSLALLTQGANGESLFQLQSDQRHQQQRQQQQQHQQRSQRIQQRQHQQQSVQPSVGFDSLPLNSHSLFSADNSDAAVAAAFSDIGTQQSQNIEHAGHAGHAGQQAPQASQGGAADSMATGLTIPNIQQLFDLQELRSVHTGASSNDNSNINGGDGQSVRVPTSITASSAPMAGMAPATASYAGDQQDQQQESQEEQQTALPAEFFYF